MFLKNHPDHLKRKLQQPFFPKKNLEINDTKTAQEGPKSLFVSFPTDT